MYYKIAAKKLKIASLGEQESTGLFSISTGEVCYDAPSTSTISNHFGTKFDS